MSGAPESFVPRSSLFSSSRMLFKSSTDIFNSLLLGLLSALLLVGEVETGSTGQDACKCKSLGALKE